MKLDPIEGEWLTDEEAVAHIMRRMKCSRLEAMELLEEFAEQLPHATRTCRLQ